MPEQKEISTAQLSQKLTLITATVIGKHFDLSSKKMNYILSELGWIKRGLKG